MPIISSNILHALTNHAAESAAVSEPAADDDVGDAGNVAHDSIHQPRQPDNFSDFSEYDFSESDGSADQGDMMDLMNDVE